MGLALHGAHTFWGLLTRTAATIAAHTLLRACLALASGSGRVWCIGSEAEVVRVGQRVPGTVIRRPGSRFRCR